MCGRLQDKVYLITGAASGMGKATTLRFTQEGAYVIAADRSEAVHSLWEGHERVTPVICDVTRQADIDAALALVESKHGRLDGICNIAGINDLSYPILDTDDARWDRVMDIDLKAPFRIIRTLLPLMIRSGGGSIVNIGSYAAIRGNHGPSYSAAKAGMVGLTRSVAFAHARDNIRCNIINPGGTDTNIGLNSGGSYHPAVGELVKIVECMPVRTAGQPEDIAGVCVFLCSEDAAWVNGAVISVDGGMSVC